MPPLFIGFVDQFKTQRRNQNARPKRHNRGDDALGNMSKKADERSNTSAEPEIRPQKPA